MELGQARVPLGVMETSECELDSTALARDNSVHFYGWIICGEVLGDEYVVGLYTRAVPGEDRAVVIDFAEQLVRIVLPAGTSPALTDNRSNSRMASRRLVSIGNLLPRESRKNVCNDREAGRTHSIASGGLLDMVTRRLTEPKD